MTPIDTAEEILQTMITHLGFPARIERGTNEAGDVLEVHSPDAVELVGENAERLEDLNYLVNRLLQQKDANAPRYRVDVGGLRELQQAKMLENVRGVCEQVMETGESLKLDAMNSFQRRTVHNLILEYPQLGSWSPDDESRLKRILIFKKAGA